MMRVVAALAGRDLRRFFRQPSRVVGSAAQPLILWAVLGAGFSGSFRPGGGADVEYLQYFYPGVVVLTLLFTAIFSTISVIEDRHHGFLQAVLAAPVSRVALVLGKCLGGVAIAAVQAGDPAGPGAAGRLPARRDELAAACCSPCRSRRSASPRSASRWPGGSIDPGLSRGHERRADPALDALGSDVPAVGRQQVAHRPDRPRPDDLRRLRRPPRLPRRRHAADPHPLSLLRASPTS